MKIKKVWALFCLATCSLAEACTGIQLLAQDGARVHGRTLEFGIEVDLSLAVIPRGYAFTGTTPAGKGLSYVAKYGAVGAMAFQDPALMDGINELGLAVGTFYFPGFASYPAITPQNQPKALSPVEFPNWVLTQFATVEEVKQALSQVMIAPTVTQSWGPTPAPFHYIVYDKKGGCLVIEPLDGLWVTYDNPIGTFTNSPPFDWHMENLRNYVHLTPVNAKPWTVNGLTLYPFGQGSGLVGIPGDFTPPSRFVRAAIFSIHATPAPDAESSVFQMFHILNNFDIPVGVVRDQAGAMVHTDKTLITCVRDPQALKYYFKTYDDQNIRVVDLKQYDLNAKAIVSLPLRGRGSAHTITLSEK